MGRQLKRRAFDHLLSLALARISERGVQRADLNRQCTLLRRKLKAMQSRRWEFAASAEKTLAPATLQAEMDTIETQLGTIRTGDRVLQIHLDTIADVLAEAGSQFRVEQIQLKLDRMDIRRDARDASIQPILIQELHNSRGRSAVILLLTLTPDALPRCEEVITAAKRALT